MFIIEDKFLPYCNKQYKLNEFGEIIDAYNKVIETVFLNNEKFVKINWYKGIDYYSVSLIVAIVKFNIKIPSSLWNKIKIFYDDNDKNNTNIINISYCFSEPLEVPNIPNFYYIPYHTGYAINRQGLLLNINKNVFINWTITKPIIKKNIKGGYRVCRGVRDYGNSVFISRHRSIGLVFLKCDSNPLKMVINHKNGIPGNDDPDNLEWMTYSQNNKHAIDTGLMPNSVVKVLMKNLITGNIIKFNSINDCAKHIGYTHSTIRIRMTRAKKYRYYDNLVFKIDDGSDWPIIDDRIKSDAGTYAVVAKNIFTGEIILFKSIQETVNELKTWNQAVSDNMIYEKNEPVNGYNCRFLTTDISWPMHCEKDLRIYKLFPDATGPRIGVIITDLIDKELNFYESIKLAADAYNISTSTIIRNCKNNKIFNGIKMSFYKIKQTQVPLSSN